MSIDKSWENKHVLKVRDDRVPRIIEDAPDSKELHTKIEPWLTALFQSEHLSLLVGSGLSSAIHCLATGKKGAGMSQMNFTVFNEQIENKSKESAGLSNRGSANIEDQIRVVNELIKGLEVYISTNVYGSGKLSKEIKVLKNELSKGLSEFANGILTCENDIINKKEPTSAEYLMSFLMSFASRSATRERLNIFTLNYDRIIEFGSELAGIRLIDRFVGSISPLFRSSRIDVDMHYNPPGIRGEPHYLEGVAYYTKLHGSLDWIYKDGYVRRVALPYGTSNISQYIQDSDSLLIYPNSSKDRETSEYPYVDLFRDLASAICRPNATIVVYGYSFGDDHVNRVISDMLTIPSTHLVIISHNDKEGRLKHFYDQIMRPAQITLLLGKHFGDLKTLVDNYLPKPAIDKTTFRMVELLKARGWEPKSDGKDKEDLK